ncbi:MAG: hypothetical protein EYX74_02695 [Desulfobulbaceae bacterium]|nr:MAG: hypothetical protein EYX74_02695 [Desulfobulbaceae bacterium]
MLFRHQLTDDPFLRDIPRYYTLRYATIYDSQGYVIQTLAGAFSLEWSARLRTEAKVELTSSSEYQVREFGFSLIYRW